MPRTKGRGGEPLDGGAIDRMVAHGVINVCWSVRVVDTNGDWTDASNWTYHEVPESAVLGRSRSATLDGGPWHLTLSLLADALPFSSLPKVYQRLEIDRVIGGSNLPYFTGIIDSVEAGWTLQDGATVQTYEIEAFGVSQRMKGYWVNSITVLPAVRTDEILKALAVTREVRGSFIASGVRKLSTTLRHSVRAITVATSRSASAALAG